MNRLSMWMTCAACAAVMAPAAVAQSDLPITRELDVVYREVDGQALRLDLSRPDGHPGPLPAVVVIHGGGWRSGDKADNRRVLDLLAREGFVAMSPQYRFCPKHLFPAQVHDVKAAVQWLRDHAEEYHVDPDRIGAMGFSAGGHLSLMLGLTDASSGLEPDDATTSSRVQAVVNYFGPTDFNLPYPDVSAPLVRDFLGGDPQEKPAIAKQASPITYVTPDDPPILTFQGTEDPLVPYEQAVTLTQALAREGVGGRLELMLGAGHGWGGPEMERTANETVAFLKEHLKSGGREAGRP